MEVPVQAGTYEFIMTPVFLILRVPPAMANYRCRYGADVEFNERQYRKAAKYDASGTRLPESESWFGLCKLCNFGHVT